MDEALLKRALVKSLRHQGGQAFRIEDKYSVGRPDLFLRAADSPPLFAEVKLVQGAKLVCTVGQELFLEDYHRPPYLLTALIGYSVKRELLYIGKPEQKLDACLVAPRPERLQSTDWPITKLLLAYRDKVLLAQISNEQ